MREIKLTERLAAVARYIPPGGTVADIGTDHGYIPVYLAQTGVARRIIASDIKPGPLDSARRAAEEYGVSCKIEFILAPGLDGIPSHGADTVVISGMGAEMIITILEKAPWTRSVRLVLQPQTKPDLLIDWLRDSGHAVSDVSLARDAGRLYVVILAGGGADEGHKLMRMLFEKRDPLVGEYVALVLKKMKKKLLGEMKGEGRCGDRK